MSLWDTLTGWVSEDQIQRANVKIPTDHIDRAFTPKPIVANQDYFRITVAQLFLQKKSQFFQSVYPAVHSLVECNFASTSVALPNVADPAELLKQDKNGDWIAKNFTLLPLMPFKGGVIRVVAGLYAVPGANKLNNFIGVLGGFAKLLAVPQLSTALAVAQPLASGIPTLFGTTNGTPLGYPDAYSGQAPDPSTANYLQGGLPGPRADRCRRHVEGPPLRRKRRAPRRDGPSQDAAVHRRGLHAAARRSARPARRL